ncbi:PQQ-binding-like beta-propeller repeat protein [Streptomyces sp. NPDC026092]|uniref:outer membrane protein assembly factor BamB family protein n=1 Tax=Streptomyces sp. NPDC026092 TaxID=3154797 RepID=UPI0033CAADF6
MRSTTPLRAVGAATLLALLAACGGGDGDGGAGDRPSARPSSSAPAEATPTPTADPLTAYDPPTRFEQHGAGLRAPGVGAVALDEQKAYYVAPGELVAWDLAGDEEIGTLKAEASSWTHHPEHDGTYKTIPYSPGLGTVDGKRYAVAAFPTSTKGSGSSPDSIGVEVVAMDAESGQEAWRTKWDLPRSDESYLVTYVAGVVGSTAVVVSHGEYRDPVTYGIDLVTRKETWRKDDFKAQLVQGTRVLGQKRGADTALSLGAVDGANGRYLWSGMGVGRDWPVKAFAPDRAWVGDPEGRAVVDSATGKDLEYEGFGEKLHSIEDCVDDQLKTTFCFSRTVRGGEISAYDRGGKRLWRVGGPSDDSGRKEMILTSAFHGVVYATFNGGTGAAIVLDGATGADKATDPGYAPVLVNAYVGLSYGVQREIDVLRATR